MLVPPLREQGARPLTQPLSPQEVGATKGEVIDNAVLDVYDLPTDRGVA